MKIKNNEHPARAIKNRLHQHFKKVSHKELKEGRAWYIKANEFATALSLKYEMPVEIIAGVIAALSPQKDWEVNKANTISFFNGKKQGLTTKPQLVKAIEIRDTNDLTQIPAILTGTKDGFKSTAFYHNILNPFNSEHVTLDRHAIGLAFYSTYTTGERIRLTKRQYIFIQDCYSEVASKYKLRPHEFQVVLWIYWRNLGGLRQHNDVPF